jgi:hypothetical protein
MQDSAAEPGRREPNMKGSAVRRASRVLVLGAALAGHTTEGRAEPFVGQAQVLPIIHLYALCAQGSAQACEVALSATRKACSVGDVEACWTHQRLWLAFTGPQPRAAEAGRLWR